MMSSSADEMARESFLVSTDWLAQHIDDPAVALIDCRFYFDGRDGHAEYLAGHLPGAVHLDWTRHLIDPEAPQAGTFKLPSAEKLRETLEPLGLSDESLIIGYDDEGGHFVSRLWATLAAYGYHNVRIMEGGIVKWRQEGRQITTDVPSPSRGTLSFDRPAIPVFASASDVLAAGNDPDTIVVDVRRLTEATGEEVRAKRGGRVPWARWAFWQENLDWDGNRTFRNLAALRARYERAGITTDKHVITYCQGAVRAAHSALTLAMLGYPNVRIYDGSWEEWGNRDDVPVAEGPLKQD